MKVVVDRRVGKFLDSINEKESAKVFEYIQLFEQYRFGLGTKYLKKVKSNVWELRPGRVRLFLSVKGELQVIIHAVHKKSRKVRREDLEVIKQRMKEYP